MPVISSQGMPLKNELQEFVLAHYLVTGCAGFIGSKVTQLLLHSGHTVLGIDILSPNSYDACIKEWRLKQLRSYPYFSFSSLDIRDSEAIGNWVEAHRSPFDAVIHLAAQAGVASSVQQPELYYETNVMGTLHLLEFCRSSRILKFVVASSSSVYGNTASFPFREDSVTDFPLSPYAASKKAAENLAHTYHYLHRMDISILRYFTVYGPAGRPDMSIFRFIQNIIEGWPLIIYGDGMQERGFTFVDDIAQGTIAALKPLEYEIINLGSEHSICLKEVVAHIEALVGRKANIQYNPVQKADVKATCADITKAKRLLNWRPQTSLTQGLQTTIEWYRTNRSWAREIKHI